MPQIRPCNNSSGLIRQILEENDLHRDVVPHIPAQRRRHGHCPLEHGPLRPPSAFLTRHTAALSRSQACRIKLPRGSQILDRLRLAFAPRDQPVRYALDSRPVRQHIPEPVGRQDGNVFSLHGPRRHLWLRGQARQHLGLWPWCVAVVVCLGE